jgi:hypothetical protein
VTWLPIPPSPMAERDAVLGLQPEPYAVLRETLSIAWRITDPQLLELCRLRLAQLMEVKAELEGADEQLLSDLSTWHSSDAFDERARAALAFAEQYHYDHLPLRDDGNLLRGPLSEREAVNFIWALHFNDSYLRALSLLEIEPDPPGSPPRWERQMPTHSDVSSRRRRLIAAQAGADDAAVVEPDFAAVKDELNRVTVRQSLVDDFTSEAIRLHNAAYQHCAY